MPSTADPTAPPVAVLGAGSWGTALAVLLAHCGQCVRLWGRDPAQLAALARDRENAPYLPGVVLPPVVFPTADLGAAVDGADAVLVVAPSRALRALAERLADCAALRPDAALVSCTKGLEHTSGLRMSEILAEALPRNPVAALSGPSHAEEVARLTPAAVVIGAAESDVAARLQGLLHCPSFRAYTSDDVAGIELGGALKNVFALAAGVADGLGLGDNTKAALVTRSLAELVRLGVRLGGQRETFHGLSGLGDLMVTCFSRHSRNRRFGELLGRGESPEAIAAGMRMVAEGVPTTRSAWECAQRLGVDAPVTREVFAMLHEGKAPRDSLAGLMEREPKPEKELPIFDFRFSI